MAENFYRIAAFIPIHIFLLLVPFSSTSAATLAFYCIVKARHSHNIKKVFYILFIPLVANPKEFFFAFFSPCCLWKRQHSTESVFFFGRIKTECIRIYIFGRSIDWHRKMNVFIDLLIFSYCLHMYAWRIAYRVEGRLGERKKENNGAINQGIVGCM